MPSAQSGSALDEAAEEHVRLLLDCAEICQTSANFMLRGSQLHGETCAVCADVCDRCAKRCEAMGSALLPHDRLSQQEEIDLMKGRLAEHRCDG